MTTIILVILGILIAAVAAIMMIFYGGDAYDESHAKAEAGRLVSESTQIEAAVQAYTIQEEKVPGNGTGVDASAMSDLISRKYLTHSPKGFNQNAGGNWKIDYTLGIARATMGDASDPKIKAICQQARIQVGVGVAGDSGPHQCNQAGLSSREPCCIMSAAEAGL